MKFTNSYEVIHLIEQKKRNGIALRQLKTFMETQGNPQLQLSCIHVGGTNGKGSTSNAIASVLIEAGYHVGMFTSPYLETHHDRIRINDQFIDDQSIVEYANTFYDEWVKYDLSMFEIDMFVATKYFLENNVDYAIFEVGLGGEQDATNIIDPLVSVITNIGLDHMDYLGDTYEEIALAKAGIIKENKALITAENKPACLSVFKSMCEKKHSAFIQCEKPKNIHIDKELHFDYQQFKNIIQPTLAKYQACNTSLAIETLLYLKEQHKITFSDQDLYKGIANAKWKGRFEVVNEHPMIILDGAHNQEGIRALVDTCKSFKHIKILFTALKDKPYKEMVKALLTISEDITICEFDFYRAQEAQVIAEGFPVRIIKDAKLALDTMIDEVKEEQVIVVCGSLYFISEIRKYILDK